VDDRDAYLGNERYGVIVDFLRGQRPDWEGRWLADIRTWDDGRLEEDHRYIQWLFPLTTESEAVFAPILREHEVAEIRQDRQLQGELIASLHQMLGFYGFALNDEGERMTVSLSERHEERNAVWMTPGNHNYRRIARILGSLMGLKVDAYAKAFLVALEALYQTPAGSAAIDEVAMWYWRQRASAG
jgi:hypothetical protein